MLDQRDDIRGDAGPAVVTVRSPAAVTVAWQVHRADVELLAHVQTEEIPHVRLEQGAATVNDGCFTGDTNVVLCTDATSASPIQCTASSGKLTLAGTGADLINYARVR